MLLKRVFYLALTAGICAASVLVPGSLTAESATPDQPISYHRQIQPLFRAHCFGCHQNARRQGDYLMTDFAAMLAGGETGEAAIVPGKPETSYLLQQIELHDGVAEMPKAPAKPLHETEIELVRKWIEQGAINDSPMSIGPVWSSEHPPIYQGHPTLPSIDLSPDGKWLAIAGHHEVLLMSTTDGKVTQRLVGQSPRITSVRFAPDGKRLAAAGGTPGEQGELQVWNIEGPPSLLLSRSVTYDTLSGASWSPDGKLISFGANDNVLRAVDSQTGEQVLYQGAHEDWVRDTVFSRDGEHLVSVARDMSCKLTEVETERFIDNITSITPGALSGGLTSVAMHPQRDEIVVGGSDGIVKVYRVFRQTKRQIGDDANLIRRLPKLDGRIRSVVLSPDGQKIAAVATIDGHSELRVWQYDFDGKLDDKLKGILGKRVAQRKPDEKELVEKARNAPVKELVRYELPQSTAYSLDVGADGSVYVAATDGLIRKLDPSGKLVSEFSVVEIQSESTKLADKAAETASELSQPSGEFDATWWTAQQTEKDNTAANQLPAWAAQVQSLSVAPSLIELDSPYAYHQLVVTATLDSGITVDATPHVTIGGSDRIAIGRPGLVRATGNGNGQLNVALGDVATKVDWVATDQDQFAVDFVQDVNPVLSRLGCNQGTCHGAQKGKNGFRLSLRGYDPIFDLRALTDDLAARRINPAAPEDSLMLRKPLGLTPHEGGTLMQAGDPYHAILRKWIADGSKLDLQSVRVASIEISPRNPVVQATDAVQQVRVVATFTDGTSRDVTQEAFIESGNTEVATAGDGGVLQAVRRGEAPVLARYEGAYDATILTVMGDRSGYEEQPIESWNRIDELVAQKWQRMKIVPSELCDDATFLRRVHLDLTGLPPASDLVREFLADNTPSREKRAAMVDRLIGSDEFIEFWTNKWADLLQVNRKFLGVEGSQKYRDWIRTAVAENRPYDQFARQIVTASGSNNENPPASYYKVLRTAEDAMENTTHLFLGIRFNCNKCHDHPFERWTQDQYYEMAAFFAQIDRVRDPVSKNRKVGGTAVESAKPLYEIIKDTGKGEIQHARTGQPVPPSFPYELSETTPAAEQTLTVAGASEQTKPDAEQESKTTSNRREALATWMTHPGNPYFARSYANRVWGYLTGVGLIEPIDDIRAGNPPTNPELLDYLTDEFIASGFDSRHLMRLVCNSRTYGLSVKTHPLNEDDQQNYSHATPRRLPAEVIYDAVHRLTGAISHLPGMPAGARAAEATDSGVALTDGFLQNLGRPARETACECERSDDLQLGPVMALISGPTIGSAISDPKNELDKIIAEHEQDQAVAEEIFLRALGRYPTDTELAAFAHMNQQIREDHQTLVDRLADAEADWKQRFPILEGERAEKLKAIKQAIVARQEEIKPEREKLAANREQAIKQAEAELAKERTKLPEKIEKWVEDSKSDVLWHPLLPVEAKSDNDVKLSVLPDRSVLASGKADTATYTIQLDTDLTSITGLRVEALTDPSLPSNGPGLASNFVVTELAISAGPVDTPKAATAVKIASAKADFLQNGFSIEQTFDGNVGNQNAWAVSGANGMQHWATFQFAEPIKASDPNKSTRLTVTISQKHNAKNHLLGRFRISATRFAQPIPLTRTEELDIAAKTPAAQRTETQSALLTSLIEKTDKALTAKQAALAEAKKAIPPDAPLVKLQAKQKALEVVTPVDPKLFLLRENTKRSADQLKNRRLTAAEDLTWALVNTPAFLFNH